MAHEVHHPVLDSVSPWWQAVKDLLTGCPSNDTSMKIVEGVHRISHLPLPLLVAISWLAAQAMLSTVHTDNVFDFDTDIPSRMHAEQPHI